MKTRRLSWTGMRRATTAGADTDRWTGSCDGAVRGRRRLVACATAAGLIIGTAFSPAATAARARNLPPLLVDAPSSAAAPGSVYTVRVLLTSRSTATIRFTLSGLPVGSSTKMTMLNARERRIQIGIPSTAAPGDYEARFRTTNPGLKRTDTFVFTVSGPAPTIPPTAPPTVPPVTVAAIAPQFQITSVAERTVRLGGLTTFPVQIARQNQWVGPVRLVVDGLPAGSTAGFLPFNPTSDPSSEFRVVTPSTTAPGDYTLRITATAGDQTRLLSVLLKVRGPESLAMIVVSGRRAPIGATTQIGHADVSIVNSGGSEVVLSAEQVPSGVTIAFGQPTTPGRWPVLATISPRLPANTVANFVIVARTSEATAKSTASLITSAAVAAGLRYQVTAVASPAGEALAFGLAADSGSVVVQRGQAAVPVTVTITPKGGFSGLIDFTVVGLPSGVIAAIEPGSTPNSVRMLLAAPGGQPLSSTTIRLRGVSGSLTGEIGIGVRIAA